MNWNSGRTDQSHKPGLRYPSYKTYNQLSSAGPRWKNSLQTIPGSSLLEKSPIQRMPGAGRRAPDCALAAQTVHSSDIEVPIMVRSIFFSLGLFITLWGGAFL